MRFEELDQKPDVMTARNFAIAFLAHVALFAAFWLVAKISFKPRETIIPIDLTLVVNENLDGNEEEPPPTQNPVEALPPEPKPEPKTVEPPPVVDEKVDALVKTPEKKIEPPPKPPEKKVEEKPKEPEKPKPPEKTKEELRKERLERMRKSAVVKNGPVKIEVKDAPSGNGRTERKTLSDAEIRKLLNLGYKPGSKTQLATSELQRCLSLVQMAINRKWDEMNPSVGAPGNATLSLRFTSGGIVTDVRLVGSCGDRTSDDAALKVARAVGRIHGLSSDFLAQFSSEPLTINYRISNR